MAVYKTVKGVSKNNSGLKAVLEYIGKEKEGDRIYKTTGINVSEDYDKAFKQMMITKRVYNKLDGRQYRHHIQSFKPGEVTEEIAHEIGVKFAEENFKDFDVFVATHIDKGHIHNHFIINTIHNETGMKFRELNKKEFEEKDDLKSHEFYLENLKNKSDELCREYGLSILEKRNPKSLNIYDKKSYIATTKNKGKDSYKTQLALTVQKVSKCSASKEDFIKKMLDHFVIVDWKENKKHITFHFMEENKKSIRLANLEKTYKESLFTKEGLEREFEKNYNQEVLKNIEMEAIKEQKQEKTSEQLYKEMLTEKRLREQREEAERKSKEKAKEKKIQKTIKPKSRGYGIGD